MDLRWNLPLNLPCLLLSGLSLSSEEDLSSMLISSFFTLSSSNVFIFMEMICGSPMVVFIFAAVWCGVV